jgi:hypothetical protein
VYLTLSMCVPFNLQTMATSCYSKDSCSKKFADNDKQRLLQNTLHYYISAHIITWEALSAIDGVWFGVQSNTGILVGLRSSWAAS